MDTLLTQDNICMLDEDYWDCNPPRLSGLQVPGFGSSSMAVWSLDQAVEDVTDWLKSGCNIGLELVRYNKNLWILELTLRAVLVDMKKVNLEQSAGGLRDCVVGKLASLQLGTVRELMCPRDTDGLIGSMLTHVLSDSFVDRKWAEGGFRVSTCTSDEPEDSWANACDEVRTVLEDLGVILSITQSQRLAALGERSRKRNEGEYARF